MRLVLGHTEQVLVAGMTREPKEARTRHSVDRKMDVCGKALEKKAPEVAFMACQCHDKIREDQIVCSQSPHSHSPCSQMLAKMIW